MDFLGMGPLELLVIFVIILIVFGPGKLPEVAGQIGKAVREVRKATTEMTRQMTEEVEAGKKGLEEAKSEIESAVSAHVDVQAPPTRVQNSGEEKH